ANKPLPEEIDRCLVHLDHEVTHLPNLQVVVALGKIAWDAWLKLLTMRGIEIPRPKPKFGHGVVAHLHPCTPAPSHPCTLIGIYHPSRQNTNTGVVTPRMYDAVFRAVRESLH
ncbi:MAG: uracil-DNA glycosylase family protein, partial [Acidobacteriota bacterium]